MNEELLREFLIESHENLDRLDKELVYLERNPHDRATLASVFRTIHTIKGSCGFLALSKLEAISHAGESLLARMREGELILDGEITTALLGTIDAIRKILASVEATGEEGDGEYSPIVSVLTRLGSRQAAASVPGPDPNCSIAVGEVVQSIGEHLDLRRGMDEHPDGDDRRVPTVSDSSLRIDVGLLDKLMNLVGELVLARNQILQFRASQTDAAFVSTTQRLNLVTSELQEAVMKTRMQPIGNVWSKFPRIVRDLATQCGKDVQIEMEGKETELDKTIIEAIKDPLTHVIRNSVDHGIELPAVRSARGKPAEGRIRLRAYHEGGQINIEMSDDGAGIEPGKVSAKAIRGGLITSEQASRMSDADLVRLVFLPGLSTSENVSNLSGRGVGMDVVKTNIERIGGQVDVQSTAGKGTSVKIKIPLTLAIIPALLVAGADGERYAIPQVNLLELVRLDGAAVKTIERIQTAMFYRLRGDLLPLVSLNQVLGLPDAVPVGDAVNIVVLKADQLQFGLLVDGIDDTEEIVVKPLGAQLKGIQGFAGATIMGDGRVALILDVLALAQRGQMSASVDAGALTKRQEPATDLSAADRQTMLVFRVGESGRMALELDAVARLEEFPRRAIERSGDQELVQYRGQIMPLVNLRRYFDCAPPAAEETSLHVIVCSAHGRSVGLIVDQILDITSGAFAVQYRSRRPGVLGSVVIDQRVTDLLDTEAVLRQHDPDILSVVEAA
jgi:two-component system chemotaxis sensor kinase CheA